MSNIVFITSASHTKNSKNLNWFQRIYFLSRYANLIVIARKSASFKSLVKQGCLVFNAIFTGKIGMIAYGVYWQMRYSRKFKINAIITEPSIVGIVGFLGKIIYSSKWIIDVWDIPFRCHSRFFFTRLRIVITRKTFKILYKYADLFIVSILPDFELKYFNIPGSKMLLLNNAIWFDKSFQEICKSSKPKPFNIFCMRSYYTKDMSLDMLSNAFSQVKSKISNISLTIVGKISKEVEHQVQALRNCDNVKFTGFIEFEKLQEMITYADVCVVPYKNVPDLAQIYPVKVLEYLSLGKPVIAPRIAGIQTMIKDGYNGLLFNPGDAKDLASKIELLYKDNNLREKISKNARNLDSKYDCRVKNQIISNRIYQLCNKCNPE